ncbi:hypothetical protein [Companilactobacillus baiquanensis]|uniref:Surface layer protein A domain-containing protein n=1 Tax=Companilactobacillus baiquanensis TaxID=2486005 RepID=A0ABW1USL3_9LACO|nr:hypothetical protein [Companilactobacillus baiquanensis]
MKKSIKYAGIMSAALMVLSPIAVPTIHEVKADSTEQIPSASGSLDITIQTTDYISTASTFLDVMGQVDSSTSTLKDIVYSIKDNKGNSLNSYSVISKDNSALYETEDDALNGTKPMIFSDLDDYLKNVEDGKTYYLPMTIAIPGGNNELIQTLSNWENDPSTVSVTLNGKKIEKPNSSDEFGKVFPYIDKTAISYIRKVVVGTPPAPDTGNTGNHTTKPAAPKKGIVTTHTDQSSYSLYDENNEKIDNRALVANSSWKMDGTRTVDGIKQYRVSTDEWVNASDVDFVENGKVTEGMTVQNLDTPKEITLSTRHVRYNLQDSNKVVSTTRALAGGTSWLVDKIGTDMHGGIYYGVSTNEFVKADDGVIISK